MKIRFLGHSAFLIDCGGKKILIDPFITGNAAFPPHCKNELENPDYILITHGHGDHIGDVQKLYNPACTKIVSNYEICCWLKSRGIKNCIDMNPGGSYTDGDIQFSVVQAIHSSSIFDGEKMLYGGIAVGFILRYGKKSVYHAGDTDIFGDMRLIQKLYAPEIGLIPIGGKYTMDTKIAAMACNDFFNFETIIPMHYGTFPGIQQDAADFINRVNNKEAVHCLKPGEEIEVMNSDSLVF